ncbi:MAG: ribosome small subunit-dependent GTPase A [Synechococcus sp.]|nr:ribosome small subunit-dependent GTPase A [Synechococcus sp. MVIR-18-1]MCH9771968.1 ribosome small subunit-dependent GTPase A [Cyanobacteriota bacterium]MDA7432043.1 ribosome small subunit-dependent GTPase A [Synechococcus sp. AH-601-O06]MDA7491031.1 ribosome small subunit-dependent GTPase A [Synechococcus sp. AH-707-M23]MDB4673096.1 ribosome small subunit-dependent GTPase A [bacterium]
MVVALQANYLEVELDQVSERIPSRLLCTRRTRLSHRGEAVYVGDRVRVEAIDASHARAVVSHVEPRVSFLTRPPVANATTVVVALAVAQPAFDPDQASRFLLTAERTSLHVQLVLTKTDLLEPEALEQLRARLHAWGYPPLLVSTGSGLGLSKLKQSLAGSSLSVLCGPSGVGKSSLLNALIPELDLRIGAVSGRLQRGRHTTRHVELHRLEGEARVADTPGFNRPELPDDPRNLEVLFPELRAQLEPHPCRFRDCLHRDEPGCGVTREWERYPIYRRAVEDLLGLNRPSRGG